MISFFKKNEEYEDSITSINQYWKSYDARFPKKYISRVKRLEEKIERIKKKIELIYARNRSKDAVIFYPLALKVAKHLADLTNTQEKLVYSVEKGTAFNLEVNGEAKYRVFLYGGTGIALHTWKYNKSNIYDLRNTPSNIVSEFIYINGTVIHDFSKYTTTEKILEVLDKYCRV